MGISMVLNLIQDKFLLWITDIASVIVTKTSMCCTMARSDSVDSNFKEKRKKGSYGEVGSVGRCEILWGIKPYWYVAADGSVPFSMDISFVETTILGVYTVFGNWRYHREFLSFRLRNFYQRRRRRISKGLGDRILVKEEGLQFFNNFWGVFCN